MTRQARQITIRGRVQAVGFRPFVYLLAKRMGVTGWVRNDGSLVTVHAEGCAQALDEFEVALIGEAPTLARPVLGGAKNAPPEGLTDFVIAQSVYRALSEAHLPPDLFVCEACLAELSDPSERRYRYPFLNCTQCGPRYTVITGLPYDRAATTLAGFELCEACRREYEDPCDRRFHAEPIACPDCGPQLTFRGAQRIEGTELALNACVDALRAGQIAAVKGVGGYHLMCDAANAPAISRLRTRKHRPHKPLAVVFPMAGDDGLDAVRKVLLVDEVSAGILREPARPIVLMAKRDECGLPEDIAPGLDELGAFLPYSPLHHLILGAFGGPLIATSANRSGEPVLTSAQDVEARLGDVADVFLHHDRPIARPADDSVVRVIGDVVRIVRLGRGLAPIEVELPASLPVPVVAVGGHMKATVAIGRGRRAVLSPHIGDLDSPRALDVFQDTISTLSELYGIKAQSFVCDSHPGYASRRWALRQGLPVAEVLHHHAHASALALERPDVATWLVLTWDGVGYGEDGTLWGGEALLGGPGRWRRAGSWRPFSIVGGDKAGREPWRSAAALLWEQGRTFPDRVQVGEGLPDLTRAHAAWLAGLNRHQTSAVGRLFDAAASLILGHAVSSFEGQGPMALEAACGETGPLVSLPIAPDEKGVARIDWAPLVGLMCDETLSPPTRAMGFHMSVAQAAADQVGFLAAQSPAPIGAVGLTGGVFQNRLLAEAVIARLNAKGFTAVLPRLAPANDGGLALGQIAEYAARCGIANGVFDGSA